MEFLVTYGGIIVFTFMCGMIIGACIIPIMYFFKGRRRHGPKHGYKRGNITYPRADTSILDIRREEHSAKDY